MRVDAAQLDDYVESLLAMQTKTDYAKLMDRFGVRRTEPDFWQHSDRVQASHIKGHAYTNGLLDCSRAESR